MIPARQDFSMCSSFNFTVEWAFFSPEKKKFRLTTKPELIHTSCRSGSSNKSLCLFRQSFCPSEPDPSKEAKEWPSLTSKVFRTPGKTSKDPESKQQHQCAALFPSSETLLQDKFPEASNCRFSRSAHVTAASAT